ncbi:hypothetical protein Poly51_31300 [Rubripirellula tenax]|uniref:Uncharacterized protein n=1 Tax=Rubripirellula tenax TaxID=2528015 RepID=A0A5C6F4M7_9BACT|nr:hypothetical protein [Rubripirellula tenax]TWU54411.1 hypothetical protein Poly51_31300 [Rubripirellula tenax]
MLAFFAAILTCSCVPAFGEEIASLDISALPPPPPILAERIESGRVTFEFGDRDPSLESTQGPRVSAETRYRIAYHFQSHSSWRIRGGKIVIRVRFSQVRWEPNHVIWFRAKPRIEGFWDDRLVRHEFDHVEISDDRRIEALFRRRLKELVVIQRPHNLGARIREADVDKIIEDTVREIFDEVSELVAIRYKELDRVTRHGQLPLPPDDELSWRKSDAVTRRVNAASDTRSVQ